MKYKDPITGEYKELFLKASDTLPIGAIVPYGSDDIPTNWLLCDGSAVSRTTYASLFSVIGTNFGEGDGETTFNLPDFRSKIPLGKDISDEDFNTLGKTYGEKEHTLNIDEMPSHKHGIRFGYGTGEHGTYNASVTNKSLSQTYDNSEILNEGGSKPHNIVQPSLVTNYIIKAGMSVGIVGNVVNEKIDSSKDTYSCDYIENLVNESMLEAYTEDEVRIGTFLGKPLYRKVGKITFDSVYNGSGSHKRGSLISKDIEYGTVTEIFSSVVLSTSLYNAFNSAVNSNIYVENTERMNKGYVVGFTDREDFLNKAFYVVVKYTKTTDITEE